MAFQTLNVGKGFTKKKKKRSFPSVLSLNRRQALISQKEKRKFLSRQKRAFFFLLPERLPESTQILGTASFSADTGGVQTGGLIDAAKTLAFPSSLWSIHPVIPPCLAYWVPRYLVDRLQFIDHAWCTKRALTKSAIFMTSVYGIATLNESCSKLFFFSY